MHECVEGGAEEYLVKPVTRKEVQHIWQHVARKRSAGALAGAIPQGAAATPLVQAMAAAISSVAAVAVAMPMPPEAAQAAAAVHRCSSMEQEQAVSVVAAAPPSAPPTHQQQPPDLEAVGQFLSLLREEKKQQLSQAAQHVAALDEDIAACGPLAAAARCGCAEGADCAPAAKRARIARVPTTDAEEESSTLDPPSSWQAAAAAAAPEAVPGAEAGARWARVAPLADRLQELFFEQRQLATAHQQTTGGWAGVFGERWARDVNHLHTRYTLTSCCRKRASGRLCAGPERLGATDELADEGVPAGRRPGQSAGNGECGERKERGGNSMRGILDVGRIDQW